MTKLTLLTAASVATLAFAGAAQAGTITGSINNATTATAAAPYTIAGERTNAADKSTATTTITNTMTSQPTITTGAGALTYRVVFDITGGTILTNDTVSIAVVASGAGGNAATSTFVQGARSETSIEFIVTVAAPVNPSQTSTIEGFTLTAPISNSNAEADISFASTTSLLAGGVATVVDTTAATKLIRYVNALGAFSVTPNAIFAALPDFKSFTATAGGTGIAAGTVATNYTVAATSSATNAVTAFFAGLSAAGDGALAAANVTAAGILSSATLAVTGGSQLNTLVPSIAVTAGTATGTLAAASASFALNEAAAETMLLTTAARPDFVLTQPGTAIVVAPTSFTTAYTPVYAAGYTAPTAASVASGSVALDGVNYLVPWVGGSQAPGQTVIRLSNSSSSAISNVQVRLLNAQARAAGVTSGPGAAIANATCATTFTIPANAELQITGTELTTCFGAFLRGDIQVTVESSVNNLTAKARNVSASGAVVEQSLGRAGF